MNKETKNKAAKLSDEDIAKATGGIDFKEEAIQYTCPSCQNEYSFKLGHPTDCPNCGFSPNVGEVYIK